ncbi:polysaccharide biosynthesis tyrosine autokinase [Phormidium sp. FACHB-592]|uniref:Polysaccharide biosynthesis tyrosine autokinase n=1 Tax=Stenomitos frigidus AS-A4 TaxID=2933935 RepID=A0ABV0KRM5_9CYAN|nr:polysaccharide biosynthesis tyrosine autokinase [Phormidium sp. FACHB-592]MBD2072867.1 polysaccharide biosynthesis tyrosine autokinase [Phormidium sp. FACHB-592]
MEAQSYPEDIDFGKYWLILKRRWVPAGSVFVVVLLLTAIVVALQKPGYEASGKILFRKRDTTAALLTEGAGKVGELESLSQQNTPIDTEAEVLRSLPLIEKTITELDLRDKEGKPVEPEKALKNLTAKGIKGTDVLLVSYKSADPKEAAAFVNQLIKAYLDSNVLVNRTETTAAREFIAQQLPKTEAELRQAEINLRNFKEQNNVVGLKAESDSVVTSIAAFNSQISMAQARLANTSAQIAAISARLGFNSENAVILSSLRQSSGVQKAFIDLQQLESQLAIQRSRYQESNPVITSLQAKQASLKALLQERIKEVVGDQGRIPQVNLQSNESTTPALLDTLIESFVNNEVARLGLINELNSLSSSQRAYQQRANMLPQVEQELQGLERRVETIKSNYELLVKRFQEVQISESQNLGNARVVSAATIPNQPSASKKKLILIGGFLVGSLLYVVTAFVIDLTDSSVKTVKEIREVFKYPWLGLIPFTRKNSNKDSELYEAMLPVKDAPLSLVSEAYRMLHSNLKFLKPDQPLKTIVVTSSVSKEGKSTVSANLALSVAQLGKKVLLIDADLHHPVQHHIWNITNAVGLSDLVMKQIDSETAIEIIQENLHVLPAGKIAPNSLAIIDSSQMAKLVKEFSQIYDLVIFDTPPLILISGVLALGKMVDGVLLVARPGTIDLASATAANELLTQSNQEVLGLVVNGVIEENEPNSYLRRSRSYHEDNSSSLAKLLQNISNSLKSKS